MAVRRWLSRVLPPGVVWQQVCGIVEGNTGQTEITYLDRKSGVWHVVTVHGFPPEVSDFTVDNETSD